MSQRFGIRPQDVGFEPVDDEMLLIDFVSSDYYLLNGTAAIVWAAIAEAPHSAGELARRLPGVNESSLAADGLVLATDDDTGPPTAALEMTGDYVVPRFEKFGTLERLMLAGE